MRKLPLSNAIGAALGHRADVSITDDIPPADPLFDRIPDRNNFGYDARVNWVNGTRAGRFIQRGIHIQAAKAANNYLKSGGVPSTTLALHYWWEALDKFVEVLAKERKEKKDV